MEEIENRIKAVIASVLKVKPEEIDDTSSPRSITTWKGLNHRKIIEDLEEEFKISFDRSEIDTFVNFKIIKSTIVAHLD